MPLELSPAPLCRHRGAGRLPLALPPPLLLPALRGYSGGSSLERACAAARAAEPDGAAQGRAGGRGGRRGRRGRERRRGRGRQGGGAAGRRHDRLTTVSASSRSLYAPFFLFLVCKRVSRLGASQRGMTAVPSVRARPAAFDFHSQGIDLFVTLQEQLL
jgi:hypothetical protein